MSQLTQSTIRNQLLWSLTVEDFGLLSPHLEPVDLPFKQVLIVPEEPIRHVHFPDVGLGSFLSLFEGGGSLEVGMIGWDGMIGIPILHLKIGKHRLGKPGVSIFRRHRD